MTESRSKAYNTESHLWVCSFLYSNEGSEENSSKTSRLHLVPLFLASILCYCRRTRQRNCKGKSPSSFPFFYPQGVQSQKEAMFTLKQKKPTDQQMSILEYPHCGCIPKNRHGLAFRPTLIWENLTPACWPRPWAEPGLEGRMAAEMSQGKR